MFFVSNVTLATALNRHKLTKVLLYRYKSLLTEIRRKRCRHNIILIVNGFFETKSKAFETILRSKIFLAL